MPSGSGAALPERSTLEETGSWNSNGVSEQAVTEEKEQTYI